MLTKLYTPLWNKYRPALLQMIKNAENEPQQYQLSGHEFKAFNDKKNAVFSFDLRISNGKAIVGIKNSAVAQDLWEILSMSPKATDMLATGEYEFTMNRQFVLSIKKNNNVN